MMERTMLVKLERVPRSRPRISDIFDSEKSFDGFFGDFLGSQLPGFAAEYPVIDVRDQEKEHVLVAELPGLKKDEVKISLHEGVLTISGERKVADLPEKATWIRNEILRGSFSRRFKLPRDVDAGGVSAELKNGILRIVLPKSEKSLPRDIAVR
jgi:HSP20 family protein